MSDQFAVVIPAYQAEQALVDVVKDLKSAKIMHIIIVNDGSTPSALPYYENAKSLGATVLNHPVNKGKCAAIKTAMQYILSNMPNCEAIVTADADGQHASSDVLKVMEAYQKNPSFVIGYREFTSDIPLRSSFGNIITHYMVLLFYWVNIYDTQSGLRAIPRTLFKKL